MSLTQTSIILVREPLHPHRINEFLIQIRQHHVESTSNLCLLNSSQRCNCDLILIATLCADSCV
jgi:hypothetical protein